MKFRPLFPMLFPLEALRLQKMERQNRILRSNLIAVITTPTHPRIANYMRKVKAKYLKKPTRKK